MLNMLIHIQFGAFPPAPCTTQSFLFFALHHGAASQSYEKMQPPTCEQVFSRMVQGWRKGPGGNTASQEIWDQMGRVQYFASVAKKQAWTGSNM